MLSVTVNTIVDELDGSITDGDVSIRDAVALASPGETINFASSVNGSTITLNRSLGQIDIAKSLTIDASMLSNGITIHGNDPTGGFNNNGDGIRIFNILDPTNGVSPPSVTMIGMTLTEADPAPGEHTPEGGAIRSEGILTLQYMKIRENGAGNGAGVYLAVAGNGSAPRDILKIENSRIEHNSAWEDGGGVFVLFSSTTGGQDTVLITGSTLSNNIAGPASGYGLGGALRIASGFGLDAHHKVIATRSTFNTNSADVGGGVYHTSYVYSRVDLSILENSAISGNTATNGAGGGVYSQAYGGSQIHVNESAISGNTSSADGGGVTARLHYMSSLAIEKSQISGNTATNGDGGGGGGRGP